MIIYFWALVLMALVLVPFCTCPGLWLAGYKFGAFMVAAFLVIAYAMEFTQIGKSSFAVSWYEYLLATKSMYLVAGLITTCYAIVILRHMLFSKTMPWTVNKEE